MLATDQANSTQLADILAEDRTRTLLPPDLYADLQTRVEHAPRPSFPAGAHASAAHGGSYERLHTHPTPTSGEYRDQVFSDAERMKGVGDTLNNRFVLEECIGFGGMGTVYKALDLRKLEASDRSPYIAIKVLNVQFRGHPKSLIALQREAKKAQTLAHPNIVTVYDFDRDGSTVYLTMEYLSGKPLSHMLRSPEFSGMPLANALRVVNGMGRALAYAHERGFVHCDFKPANVILTESGEVKVIDFGIARVFHKPTEEVEATVFDPGSLGGLTPAYASPEMLEHREPDPRDDIYALGCITYELLTGRHPFDRMTAAQARNAGMTPQRPRNLGSRQWRALKHALSFDRATRTPTVHRFLEEMSGERRGAGQAVMLASSLALAVVLAVGIAYYWESWTGGGTDAILAESPEEAIPQSAPPVVQPAPPPLSAETIDPVLAGVPCSALVPFVQGGTVQVDGYLPGSYGAGRLKEMLISVPGVQSVNLNVQQVSDDKCAVLQTFAPYWKQARLAGAGASIHAKPRDAQLTEGDFLVLDLTTPAYDSHVNVDYYSFDGGVVHLVPSPRAKANQAPPNYSATIGSLGNWVVSKPFGTDMIVLLITPAPLFDGLRPETESAATYLGAVEKRLAQLADKYGREKIAVDFLQITTRGKKS